MVFAGNPKKGFIGTKKVNFKIKAASIVECNISYEDETNDKEVKTSKANGWKQNFKVLDADGKALTVNKDYEKEAKYTLIQDAEGREVCEELDSTSTVYPGSVIQVIVTGTGFYKGDWKLPHFDAGL